MALETASAGKIAPRVPPKVSMDAGTSIARSRLARVLLNIHVMTTVNATAVMLRSVMPRMRRPTRQPRTAP